MSHIFEQSLHKTAFVLGIWYSMEGNRQKDGRGGGSQKDFRCI